MGIKMEKKIECLILVTILSMLFFSSNSVDSVRAIEQSIRIITPHWEGIRVEYERAFKDWYLDKTGNTVVIEWIYVGGTSDIITYIDSTFAANLETTSNIDVWWGGGVDPFLEQKNKGHLQPYQLRNEILDLIPSDIGGVPMYDTQDYTWYGSALSGFGIIYNKIVLELEGLPVPTTWEDLIDPALRGWVGSADPRHSGSTHMVYEIMLQAYGWEEGLKISTLLGANVKTWPQSSSAVPKSVAAGDIAYGLAIDFYAWSQVAKVGVDRIGYVLPEGLTVINPDSIAILKGAPNEDVAKSFLEFILSEAGQKLWMLPVGVQAGPQEFLLGRMGIIPSLYTELGDQSVVPVNPFEMQSTLTYNSTLGSLRYVFLNDLIGSMIIDTHADLVSVWGEIIGVEKTLTEADLTSTNIDNAINTMGSAPLTEAEALDIATNWDDQELRNEYISDWHTFALEKYKESSNYAKLAGTELAQYFNELITRLESEKQNNLYMGIGGGLIIGILIGVSIVYYTSRRKEIAEVEK
jgi:ABC-type Fe3+ transport system substrate-binding protein